MKRKLNCPRCGCNKKVWIDGVMKAENSGTGGIKLGGKVTNGAFMNVTWDTPDGERAFEAQIDICVNCGTLYAFKMDSNLSYQRRI